MGTNYYFRTKDKELAFDVFNRFEIEEDNYYYLHLAKTSCGWLPLFQQSKNINNIFDIFMMYGKYYRDIDIVDEYGEELSFKKFIDEVVKHNNGTAFDRDLEMTDDMNDGVPPWTPVSHIEIEHDNSIYIDNFGYEFCTAEFC